MRDDVRSDLRAKSNMSEIDLDLDVDDLRVLRGPLEVFAARHDLDPDAAREGVLDTVDLLLERGLHRIDDRGGHILYGDGYRVVLSEDLEVVLAYATVHRERTLAQVRSGVRSRLRGSKVGLSGLLERLDDERLDELPVPAGAITSFVSRDADRDAVEDFRLRVRDALADALDTLDSSADPSPAVYRRLDDGRHVLCGDDLVIVLRADGLRVLEVTQGQSPEQALSASRPKVRRAPRTASSTARGA